MHTCFSRRKRSMARSAPGGGSHFWVRFILSSASLINRLCMCTIFVILHSLFVILHSQFVIFQITVFYLIHFWVRFILSSASLINCLCMCMHVCTMYVCMCVPVCVYHTCHITFTICHLSDRGFIRSIFGCTSSRPGASCNTHRTCVIFVVLHSLFHCFICPISISGLAAPLGCHYGIQYWTDRRDRRDS
jgi:hypothetical protein